MKISVYYGVKFMLSYLYLVFCENFHTVFAYFCVLMICIMDKTITKKNRFNLLTILFCTVVIFLNTNLSNYIAFMNRTDLYRFRFLAASFGYIFEPLSTYIFYLIICKPTGIKRVLSLPVAVINTILFIQNLFTENVFMIIPQNMYVVTNTLLVCMPIVTAAFYFILLWIHLSTHRKEYSFYRFLGLIITTGAIIIATIIEKFTTLCILDECIAISMILFYLMGYIEQSNEIIENQKNTLTNQRNALLLSQIHPHFIYNTLNSIYYLCRNDSDAASKALLDFSEYLHGTLDSSLSSELVSFSREIETTTMYTNLEKIRFTNIEVNYNIEEDNFLIPPLSIQPLVENSIRHGIRGKENGFVNINSTKKCIDGLNYYIITIEDNGNGIHERNVSDTDTKYQGDHSGIGMSNVKSRIAALVNGSFEVISSENGTTITISIPFKEQ